MLKMKHLKMWTRDTFGELFEERLHDLLELGRFDHIQNLLKLI